jgi:putative transposase
VYKNSCESDKEGMNTKPYPSDLTNEQWRVIEPLLPKAKFGGRPRMTDLRRVVNGIMYLVRTGCSWRMLPRDFPPWPTVHDYYRRFRREGIWEKVHSRLREQVRVEAGRQASPSAAIIDSQSVKTAEKGANVVMMLARRFQAENAILW